ncbi:MAG: peptidyl-prolyl cis-trans isomerase [Polyangiaceae bacterium]
MNGRSRIALVSLFALACACRSPAPTTHKNIGGDVVASAGSATISAALLTSVARAQQRTADSTLQLLLDDALLSEGARSSKIDQATPVARDLTALRAQLVADRLRNDARAAGPCSDAEIDALSKLHLKDVELPERVQVIHAIAIRPKKEAPNQAELVQHAHEVADAIEAAVQGASSAEDFEARAKTVAHGDVDVRVESLPAFADDGTVPETGGGMDATFAHAAFALAKPGDISSVTETSFGWHVIRLNQRLPAKNIPHEERRTLFAEECVATRARTAFQAVLAARHAAVPIEIAQDAYVAMTSVPRRPDAP